MTLAPGTRLGPYEIVSALGAGGMGEVYRAMDTRLGRAVAVKVLSGARSPDVETRLRFEREARLVSQLQHPHICSLYDVGQERGIDFLVMECLEGETLAVRLAKGPLPFRQALETGAQICEALSFSHRQGVIHRDLKPENVMLTGAGAKLLDFGLARLSRTIGPARDNEEPLTSAGIVVGTLEYMSPEQLSGEPADSRSDVFAFGCVLYEMVTGQKAFPGVSQASVIGAILDVEPRALSTLKPSVPAALDRALAKCLSKRPDDRWQSASDLGDELRWILSQAPSWGRTLETNAPTLRRSGAWKVSAAVLGLALAALGGFVGRRFAPRKEGHPPAHLMLPLSKETTLAPAFGPALALSPDGRVLAYVGRSKGVRHLFLKHLDPGAAGKVTAAPLFGTEGADGPFFSLDGRWLGFFANGKLLKMPAAGGPPVPLADAAQGAGAVWLRDDTIVYAPSFQSGLFRVPAAGGAPSALTTLDAAAGERTHRFPDLLPDGKSLVFVVGDSRIASFAEARLDVVSLADGKRWPLVKGASYARVLPSGRLVFCRAGSLLATRLDLRRGQVEGTPSLVVEGVRTSPSGAAHVTFSGAGDLVYAGAESGDSERTLVWVDRSGKTAASALCGSKRAFQWAVPSPDGESIATVIRGDVLDVWVLEIARCTLRRLTFGKANSSRPVFAVGAASRIVFCSWGPGQPASLHWTAADGSEPSRPLVVSDGLRDQRPSSVSPDGRTLLVNEFAVTNHGDVVALPLPDGAPAQGIVQTAAGEREAVFSPDGAAIAFQSNESGRDEVYVRPFAGPGGRSQVSTAGGANPVFSPDGKEILYRLGDKVFAVAVALPALTVSPPVLLFERRFVEGRPSFDATGQRLLMIEPGEGELLPDDLNVIVGWTDEVSRRTAN